MGKIVIEAGSLDELLKIVAELTGEESNGGAGPATRRTRRTKEEIAADKAKADAEAAAATVNAGAAAASVQTFVAPALAQPPAEAGPSFLTQAATGPAAGAASERAVVTKTRTQLVAVADKHGAAQVYTWAAKLLGFKEDTTGPEILANLGNAPDDVLETVYKQIGGK